MPAFSAAAAYLVTAFVGIEGAAILGAAGVAFLTSAVAVGLAAVTSRLINGAGNTGGSGNTTQDPGVRIQLPPATNNKVPIVYGSAQTKGTISDARISNENKTMTYVMILSEKTQTGNFTIGDIFWNDSKLVFNSSSGSEHIVASSIDQNGNGNVSTNYAGLIRIRIYSGGVDSANQIFPSTGTPVNARTLLAESDTNYNLSDLVFAVVQVDYNSEKGTTGLGQITYQVNNSLNNPGLVWYDYMTSQRYGAGIDSTLIDTASCISTATTSLYSISNEIPDNQYEDDGTTPSTQPRYQINGVLSTGDTVKNNIEKIGLACASWTTYDFSEGKWAVVVNRKATDGEKAASFQFTDDNIIGDVGITATNLEDLYNILEVEFPSRTQRDQNDYYRDAISAGQRNDLEPDNVLGLRVDMVNNALHAARVGLIELKQSRVDLIISFRADYSAIQCEAGDVIKVTNDVYGFDEKLFRITKLREVEGDDGSLLVEVTALAYDDDVYADETLSDFAPSPASGIPQWGSSEQLPPPSAPVVGNEYPNAGIPYFEVSTNISTSSGVVNLVEWFYSASPSTGYIYLDNERTAESGGFAAGSTVLDTISTLPSGTWYFKARTSNGTIYSDFSSASSSFTWSPASLSGTSTFTDNIFINSVTPGDWPLLAGSVIGDYSEVVADNDLVWDATNNVLKTKAIKLEVKTTSTGLASTGTMVIADRASWDPAGVGTGSNYVAYYDGTTWISLNGGGTGGGGYTGSVGYTGSASAIAGPTGPIGYTGSGSGGGGAGYTGSIGYTGSVGIGYTGSVGVGYTGSAGATTAYIFDGGAPSSNYSLGPAFDCGGVN